MTNILASETRTISLTGPSMDQYVISVFCHHHPLMVLHLRTCVYFSGMCEAKCHNDMVSSCRVAGLQYQMLLCVTELALYCFYSKS